VPILEDIQNLDIDAVITLWRFEMPEFSIDEGFTSSASDTIQFDAKDYEPLPIDGKGFGMDSQSQPRPTIAVSNVNSLFTAVLFQFGNLLGCKVTRFQTFKKYLDGEPAADPSQRLPDRVYYVNRVIRHDREAIELELMSALDGTRRKIPARVMRRTCDYTYRTWNGIFYVYAPQEPCPYSGAQNYDDNNQPTADPFKDSCSKTSTGCQLRFGVNTQLPIRAFPGAGR